MHTRARKDAGYAIRKCTLGGIAQRQKMRPVTCPEEHGRGSNDRHATYWRIGGAPVTRQRTGHMRRICRRRTLDLARDLAPTAKGIHARQPLSLNTFRVNLQVIFGIRQRRLEPSCSRGKFDGKSLFGKESDVSDLLRSDPRIG